MRVITLRPVAKQIQCVLAYDLSNLDVSGQRLKHYTASIQFHSEFENGCPGDFGSFAIATHNGPCSLCRVPIAMQHIVVLPIDSGDPFE
jgi:hypothetical protein